MHDAQNPKGGDGKAHTRANPGAARIAALLAQARAVPDCAGQSPSSHIIFAPMPILYILGELEVLSLDGEELQVLLMKSLLERVDLG